MNNDALYEFIRTNRTLFDNSDDKLKCILCHQLLIDPYHSECECSYCKLCIIEYLKTNTKCPCNILDCNNTELNFDINIVPDLRINSQIKKLITNCPNCNLESNLDDIIKHLDDCKKIEVVDENNNNDSNDIIITNKLNDEFKQFQICIEDKIKNYLNNQLDLINNMNLKIKNLQDENIEMKNQIDELIATNMIMKNELSEHKEFIKINEELKAELFKSTKLLYLWKIKDLPQKRQTAQNGINTSIPSKSFYTKQGGYKLRMVLCPNGHDTGLNTHLSVYIRILRSENDKSLAWPFKDTISFHILDMINKKPFNSFKFSFDLVPDKQNERFNKPINEFNDAVGTQRFIDWQELEKLNNNIMIKGHVFIAAYIDN